MRTTNDLSGAGVGLGAMFSPVLAYVFDRLLGGFTGRAEENLRRHDHAGLQPAF